jgi:hypothetical protein
MASQNPIQYDGWWVELNVLFRTTDVRQSTPEQVQIENMNKVYDYFIAQNWTPNAIAGMLGNMMVESTVNPWAFQNRSLDWSNPSAILADNGGMGLTQWTPCRKYYQWAVDSNLDPQSGTTMCDRIMYEYQNNLQWSLENYGRHTWQDFVTSTEEPWILADVWLWAYERPSDPDEEQRWENAEWVFENIHGGTGIKIPIMLSFFRNNKRKELKPRCQRI